MGFTDWFGQKLNEARGFGAKVLGHIGGFGSKLSHGISDVVTNIEGIPFLNTVARPALDVAKSVSGVLNYGSNIVNDASKILAGDYGKATNKQAKNLIQKVSESANMIRANPSETLKMIALQNLPKKR